MSELSGRPNILKRLNSDIIKNALKNLESATKAELVQETGISLTTVGVILSKLIEEGEVQNQGYDESSGGRRAERYTLNLNYSLAVALCVENKYLDYAVGNSAGELLEEGRVEITETKQINAVEDVLNSLIDKFDSIKCIGIGVPAAVANGRLFTGTKLEEWHNFNVQDYLEKKYNIPVIMENDLNAIAVGFANNHLKEDGVSSSKFLNMIYINFMTTGIGSGIIANGMLIRGFSNYAGEISFLQLGNGDTFASTVTKEHTNDEYANAIAIAIGNLSCIVNPEYVVIGGDAFEEYNLDLINEYCSRYIPQNVRPKIIHAEDYREDYISGIMHLTIEEMNSGIRLVTTKRL
ncbi:ROK family protein [Clostridium fungisolvens]|uniref:N-acetyl-D-glucosamine kinase n=1 Tax=Clostridium fungisolvens TaxID=1604897 RepID=A0A6V8SE39_9CLOT|nr:ROK family protein [Clostridium fungisolvens]GFP75330.1 N-acetyl-D-glucosamine kinase [Clostridium fungisolvens]